MTSPLSQRFLRRVTSPIGRIEIVASDTAIVSLSIERDGRLPHEDQPESSHSVVDEAVIQLSEYFAGERASFALPCEAAGTAFQEAIWHELSQLTFGEVVSYGELGRLVGRSSAGRAVGGAVGANPLPVIIPCHRVLASNGRITGYSGGNGIPTKLWLLRHEGITAVA